VVTAPGSRSPVEQVSIQIGRAARTGLGHVEIRLDPEHLGRVEVHLDVSRDGRATVQIVAETPQALDVLKADARALEQALRDAGLKADAGSIGFGLRGDQGGNGGSHAGAFRRPGGFGDEPPVARTDRAAPGEAARHQPWLDASRLDVRA
jgi:hypothetical protein